MLVLDENLPAGQRSLLRKWRIRFRSVGGELGKAGMQDEDLIPMLHRMAHPTFVSLDGDFHRLELVHRRYCLVWLNVRSRDAADFLRKFLRHPLFNTRARRMGKVVRVHSEGVSWWQLGRRSLLEAPWRDQ